MTPDEKARISRENGAKSRGPKTQEGKDRVSRNALKTGEHAEKFKHFLPPHEACLANEDPDDYNKFIDTLLAIYKPVNQLALDAVGDIAVARWQIRRYKACITMTWNLALIAAAQRPNTLAPELEEIKVMVDSTTALMAGNSVISKLNRDISRLQQDVARAERRIKFIHSTFPDAAIQTQPKPEPPVENTALNSEVPETPNDGPAPVYTTECTQTVIEGYRKLYPGRPIVFLPSDDGLDGDEILPDHTPVPRIEV
ncbi:MAG: hypothetical protein JNM66_00320 [Bryobacterales bacterium]|nr:hypothetical protein [Bryobacterales bacterium]